MITHVTHRLATRAARKFRCNVELLFSELDQSSGTIPFAKTFPPITVATLYGKVFDNGNGLVDPIAHAGLSMEGLKRCRKRQRER